MHLPRPDDSLTISRDSATRGAKSSLSESVSFWTEGGKRIRLLALNAGPELGAFVNGARCLRPEGAQQIFWNDLKLAAKGLHRSLLVRIYQSRSSLAAEPLV